MFRFILAFLSTVVFGAVWYAPLTFGDIWAKHTFRNKQADEFRSFEAAFPKALAGNLGFNFALFYLLRRLPPITSTRGAILLSLNLSAVSCLIQVGHSAFSGKSYVVYLIDSLHDIICITMSVLIMNKSYLLRRKRE